VREVLEDRRPAVSERNLRRALEAAKADASLTSFEGRLSWHSLRHSAGAILATDLELPPTTLARLMGHQDPGFTLRVYARDARDEATLVADFLSRASKAGHRPLAAQVRLPAGG
jgi:integrase